MHGRPVKACKMLLENMKGRDHLQDLGVVGRVILIRVFKEKAGCGQDLSGSGHGQISGKLM
jgi:hypothetical protein